MGRATYRNKWDRYSRQYERNAIKILTPVFKEWGNSVSWENLTEANYESQVNLSVSNQLMSDAYMRIYRETGSVHGARVGKSINTQLKNFTLSNFNTLFESQIRAFFVRYGIERVVTVTDTYKASIVKLLKNRIESGLTIVEAAREVQKIVGKSKFYRWQAMRIARTETTASANFGAIQSGEVSGFVMEKEWISALDNRTRTSPPDSYDHRNMNGKRVGANEKFNVSGQMMDYPGDPNGSAGNVINCRCTVAVVPARDSNGDLIPV